MEDYRDEQLRLRKMQIKYGSMYYTLPETYREKNLAYTEAFGAGEGFVVGYDTFIHRTHGLAGSISIGENVTVGSHCSIDYSGGLDIGDNVMISEGTKIFTHDHDPYLYTHKLPGSTAARKTVIGSNAWIGAGCILLPGIVIGEFSVIGAGSVVTHDIPPNTIAAGNPAKIIGKNTAPAEKEDDPIG